MKVMKDITVNLGNYQSVRIGVSDLDTFEACDAEIKAEVVRLGIINLQHTGVE